VPQKEYIIYIEKKSNGYVAYCPGLGCKAFGFSEKEALENLRIEIAAFESQRSMKKSTSKKK
jgi:predicted RNase H-like HicB family nuclease